MSKTKVGVIFGGQSTEHDVSVVSGTSVISNLNKKKYEIYPVYISKEGKWYHYKKNIKDIDILEIGKQPQELEEIKNKFKILKSQDVIFPALHGLYGEDGTMQGLLELLKVPYVGCKVLASSICINKIYTKIVFEKANIKQTKYITIKAIKENKYIYIDEKLNREEKELNKINEIVKEKLKYPVFVKPSNLGSSVGVNKARNKNELEKYIKIAKKYDNEILIEEEIIGREVECAVLGNEEVKASCVGEIISAEEFYDYDSKYKNKESKIIIPAKIDKKVEERIRKIAVKAFKIVNGTGLARVDFFIDKDNEIYLNEINTMPGFTKISMYPKLWENCGLKYSSLLDNLIELAINERI